MWRVSDTASDLSVFLSEGLVRSSVGGSSVFSLLFYQPPSPLAHFLPPAVSRLCFSSFLLCVQPFHFCLSLTPHRVCFPFLFLWWLSPHLPKPPRCILSSLCLRIIFCQEPLQMNSSTLLSPPPALYSLSPSCFCDCRDDEGAQRLNPAGLFVLNSTDSQMYFSHYIHTYMSHIYLYFPFCQHLLWWWGSNTVICWLLAENENTVLLISTVVMTRWWNIYFFTCAVTENI